LDEFLSILAIEEEETREDAEDNLAVNISITQEEYDGDSDLIDPETALQQN